MAALFSPAVALLEQLIEKIFMTKLFAPAAALMNRFRYPVKFTLINLIVGLAIGFLAVSLVVNLTATLNASQKELAALELLRPVARQIQYTQQHRGFSAGVLGGNAAMKEKLTAKQVEVDAAVVATNQTVTRLQSVLPLGNDWASIQQDWEKLRTAGMNLSAPENLLAHAALIGRLLRYQVTIADAGVLTGDPDLDTFYLIDSLVVRMPEMLEQLGQARAKGTGVLARHALTEQERIGLSVQVSMLQRTLDALNDNLAKTSKAAPQLAHKLNAFGNEINKATGEVVGLINNDILAEQFSTPSEVYFGKVTATIDLGYAQWFDTLMPALETQIQARVARLQEQRFWYVGTAIAVMLCVFWLLSGLYYSIVSTVRSLSTATRAMAAGDMTTRVTLNSRDELVEIADSVNQLGASLNGLLIKVRDAAAQVTDASVTLAGSSHTVAQGSHQQSNAAMNMAAAVEEMTASFSTIAENAGRAEQSSVESGELSQESSRIVYGTVGEMQHIATSVHDSAQIIEELGRDAERISAIAGAIREIADQTNLLALNAAIEAARAGEQGRGFAVVADEVRKLAERTSQQTGEITNMISSIQGSSGKAVASMKAGVARVAEGVLLSQQAGDSISRVQEGSSQLLTMVNEISVALREQSVASQEIAKNVEHIAHMSESNSAAVDSVAKTAKTLKSMAEELQRDVASFKLS
jgi:methyl-accepting chemotaxis protein